MGAHAPAACSRLRGVSVPAAPPTNPISPRQFYPGFLLGWGLGAGLVLLVRWAGQSLLDTPCRGHTLLALLMPLLLGPGGFAFTAANWRTPRLAAVGLGFVIASLFPALFLGTQDIGRLRSAGCAGGYVVVSEAGGKSVSSLTLRGGETRELVGRIGGYTARTHPVPFTLSAESSSPDIAVSVPATPVKVGQDFPIQVSAKAGVPINTFNAAVQASTTLNGEKNVANGTFGIEIRP